MLWIILLIIIVIISAFLAFRSMRDYQEIPQAKLSFGVYLVRNKHALTEPSMNKLYLFAKNLEAIISFERLVKGGEVAWVIYGPSSLPLSFPELELLELEDYLQEPVDDVYAWTLVAKSKLDKPLNWDSKLLTEITLEDDQKFFWQIASQPVELPNQFQVTIRAVVADKNVNRRMELVKSISQKLSSMSSLTAQAREETTTKIFTDFKNRAVLPKEIKEFVLSCQEILALFLN